MMKKIRAWLARRKAKREAERYAEGFRWARYTLATGAMTAERIAAHLDCARHFGDYDAFDYGAAAALERTKEASV